MAPTWRRSSDWGSRRFRGTDREAREPSAFPLARSSCRTRSCRRLVRITLPPIGNTFVSMLKDSSLIAVLAVTDLMRQGMIVVSDTFRAFEAYTFVAVIYYPGHGRRGPRSRRWWSGATRSRAERKRMSRPGVPVASHGSDRAIGDRLVPHPRPEASEGGHVVSPLTCEQKERYAAAWLCVPDRRAHAGGGRAVPWAARGHGSACGRPALFPETPPTFTFADGLHRDARILDPVEAIIGPDLLVWDSTFIIKEARDARFVKVGTRTERTRFEPPDVVSVWPACSSMPESGCMRFVPGLHTGSPITTPSRREPPVSWGQEVTVEVDERAKAVDIVLAPGQMSLHHGRVVHGSAPNRSGDRRIGFNVQYLPTHVRQVVGDGTAPSWCAASTATIISTEERRPTLDFTAGRAPGVSTELAERRPVTLSRSEPTPRGLNVGMRGSHDHDRIVPVLARMPSDPRPSRTHGRRTCPRSTRRTTSSASAPEVAWRESAAPRPTPNTRSTGRWPRRCGRCCGRCSARRPSTARPSGTDSGPGTSRWRLRPSRRSTSHCGICC